MLLPPFFLFPQMIKKFPVPVLTCAPQPYTYTLSILARHKSVTNPSANWRGWRSRDTLRMWNIYKEKGTGPSFPSCSHLLSGRDLQIPPLEFGSFTMGPPSQGLTAARPETPFLRFPPGPKFTRDRWGEGGDAQGHLPLSLLASTRPESTRAPPATAGLPAPAKPADTQRALAAGSRTASPPRLLRGRGGQAR